jgi:hypothetical protein
MTPVEVEEDVDVTLDIQMSPLVSSNINPIYI